MSLAIRSMLLWSLALLCGCSANVVFEEPGEGGSGGTGNTSTNSSTSSSTGPCNDHSDCNAPQICIFTTGQCANPCEPGACESCGPGLFCEGCVTSSCPGCKDCRSACSPITQGRCDDDDSCPPNQVCAFDVGICLPVCGPDGDCGGFAFCDECAASSCCGCLNCVSGCVGGR